jgi:hypothetical protein
VSREAAGCILSQGEIEKDLPITFASWVFNKPQYSSPGGGCNFVGREAIQAVRDLGDLLKLQQITNF